MNFKYLLSLSIASTILLACNSNNNEAKKPSDVITEQTTQALNKAKVLEQQLLDGHQARLQFGDSE